MYFDIKNIVANQTGIPGLILNEEGKIIFFNSAAKSVLKEIKENEDFSRFISESNREKFLNSLSKIRSLNLPDKFSSMLVGFPGEKDFSFQLTPVYDGKDRVILLTFQTNDKQYSIILSSEEESIVRKNKKLSDVLKFIKSNYPFTLVDKINLQREINGLEQIFFIKTPDGKFIAVNKFFADMLQTHPEKLVGKKDTDFLPRNKHYLYESVRLFIKNSGASVILYEDFLPGITELNLLEFPIKNIDNEVVAIVAFSFKKEIQKEKEKPDELENVDSVYDQIPNPVLIYDAATFKVLYSNSLAEELYSYTKEEFKELEITDLYLPEELQSLIESNDDEGEIYYNGTYKHKTNTNRHVKVDIRRSKIIYAGKEAFLTFIYPVKEEEIEEKNIPADHTNFNPSTLSQIFHEILNPINIIVGFAQELVRGIEEPTEDQTESIRLINSNHQKLMQRIDDVMEYSILKEEEILLKKEEVNFSEFFNKISSELERYFSSVKKRIVEGKISENLSLKTDPEKFKSFLKTLIKTLLNLTSEEKIYFSAYRFDEKNMVIALKDSSLNISNGFTKTLSYIFTEEEAEKKLNGTSIFTIALLRKMLKLLSGSVQLIKKNGEVLEFGILMPIQLEKESEAFEEELIFKEAEEEPLELVEADSEDFDIPENEQEEDSVEDQLEKDDPEADLSNLSCLYIEDEIDSQILLKNKIGEMNKIDFAPDLESGIKLIQENTYNFILVDINLAGEFNGLDALRIIRRIPGKEEIPIIATTAYEMPGDRDKYIAAGFSDYLSKPLNREDILRVIKDLQLN